MTMPIAAGVSIGSTLRSRLSSARYRAENLIGEGGQGQVWRVVTPAGTPYAVKWYFPYSATPDQAAAIERLVSSGPPDTRFLWPLEMVEGEGTGFGYVMELRRPEYRGMADLMQRTIEPTFRALATAGFQLADSFLQLHSKGLCYIDISFGNVFLEPHAGSILVCDNDNVRVDGRPASVAGTAKFMAPEVIRDMMEGRTPRPGRSTDLFSLSVLLFYMFMMHHPFEGRREAAVAVLDAASQNVLYGSDPVFIFDPDDDSNRPHPDHHRNPLEFWPLYPRFLRDLFTRAFTEGVRDPAHGRVQESEWRQAMVRLRDAIILCGRCGAENFVDPVPGGPVAPARPCWSCGGVIDPPAVLQFRHRSTDPYTVVLNEDTVLYPHHTERDLYDFSRPRAEVVAHPTAEGVWGLRNTSEGVWVATMPGGRRWEVPPGKSVTISPGVVVEFGGSDARVSGERVSPVPRTEHP